MRKRESIYQPSEDLRKHFEKLCNIKEKRFNIKDVRHLKDIIAIEWDTTRESATKEQLLLLYNHLNFMLNGTLNFAGPKELYAAMYEPHKVAVDYLDHLSAFQKMALCIAEKKSLDLTGTEVRRINELMNFKIPPPEIQYNWDKPIVKGLPSPPEVKYPSFLPEEMRFPILSACAWFLCEIETERVPYSLKLCGYKVPGYGECEKILLQSSRGRKRKWCASHRTYASKQKRGKVT